MSWSLILDVEPQKMREMLKDKTIGGKSKMVDTKDEKKFESVKDKQITVTGIELESNPVYPNLINKVRFKTDLGDITWKPKIEKSVFIDGLKKITKEPMSVDDLPQKLKELGKTIQSNGKVIVIAVYQRMETKDPEGQPQVYRFIQSVKTLDNWQVVEVDGASAPQTPPYMDGAVC